VYPGKVRLLGAVIDPKTRLGTVRVSGIAGNGVAIADGGVKSKEEVVSSAGAFLQEGETVKPVLKQTGTS
jgi:hypothetical protein